MAWRKPDSTAIFQAQSRQATALMGIKIRVSYRGLRGKTTLPHDQFSDGRIYIPVITRHAPLNATDRTARTDAHLPDNCALVVWIKGVDDPGFLSNNQEITATDRKHHGG